MAIKKSELYSYLWKSCDQLRGGMDASQYKDYVLVLLFVKYVSDKYAGQSDALIEVPDGGGFADMVVLKGDKEIGDKINKIISRLAEANNLKGVIDVADFNDPEKLGRGKDMVDKLSQLVAIFENPGLDFRKNRAEGDDILGDAYEYLMRHFATESGKSKGQFYTPAEVSRIMAKVIGINQAKRQDQTIYDPTCGSGSLLLKAANEAPRGVTIYGQEMDNATAALARMNMILHNNPTAEIWQDNTLANPHFRNPDGTLKTFDFVVANPPFSNKSWSNGLDPVNDEFERFKDGVPPRKFGDFAFLLHLLRSLKSTGKGAIIMPHGILYRGKTEADIRKNIVRKGYIKGIIGLPSNLFYGTSIPACIVVLDKEYAASREGIFMIDASKGFVKDGNKNRLRHQDIHKIVHVFNRQIEVLGYSRLVPFSEISAPGNDYNLNIPRYIESIEHEDRQDIEAHLLGGIPERDINNLVRYWEVFPSLREMLFTPGQRLGYCELSLSENELKATILTHPEFLAYTTSVIAVFECWREESSQTLRSLNVGVRPKEFIGEWSESLLRAFTEINLVDSYDIYQHLMTYWTDTMQDDMYMIATDGWQANENLIPPRLIIARYFVAEQSAINALEAAKEIIEQKMAELKDEHGSEEGLLSEAYNEKGNITKGSLEARLMVIASDAEYDDERAILEPYLALVKEKTNVSTQVKEAKQAIQTLVATRYLALNEFEIKTLVVDDKWLANLASGLQNELTRTSRALIERIQELQERYDVPLPQLVKEVSTLSSEVEGHLRRMGFLWD